MNTPILLRTSEEGTKDIRLQLVLPEGRGVICVQPPLSVTPHECIEIFAIDTRTIDLSFQAEHGGAHVFTLWEKNHLVDTAQTFVFYTTGAGYYRGDTHTHSTCSDGKHTLDENRAIAAAKGLSFLISTDHNTTKHYSMIDALKPQPNFLHLKGYEYTTPFGHFVVYGTAEKEDPKTITKRGETALWQTVIDRVNQSGFGILAHPYEGPEYEFGDNVVESLRDYAGVEVWNGFNHHALSWQNQRAFRLWDKLNQTSETKVYGNAVSDCHVGTEVGNICIEGWLDSLQEENVYDLLRSGSFFGTNGPGIRFTINQTPIGKTVPKEEGFFAEFQITAFDAGQAIENIKIIRGKKGSDRAKTQTWKEYFPQGSDRCKWTTRFFEKVEPNDFFRIEVITAYGMIPLTSVNRIQQKGFAYTNPIWIEA